jgi:glycosyltransferase involved in cell wall biosynthesis
VRIGLLSPSNEKETSFVQFQTDFARCMSEFVEIDYLSDREGQFGGVTFKDVKLVNLNDYDLLHFQWGNNPLHLFEYSLLEKMKFFRKRIPVVSTIHEVDLRYLLGANKNDWLRYYLAARYFRGFYKELFRGMKIPDILTTLEIANRSNMVVVNSQYAKNRMLQEFKFNFDANKIVTAYLGVDSHKFDISRLEAINKTGIKLPNDKVIFLYVGFLHEPKSIDLIIKALYYIKKFAKRDDFFFLIVGEGEDKARLQRLVNKLVPEDSTLVGFVDDTAPYYKIADVVVNPRSYCCGEVSGVIPEAFSAGKPIIAPNMGCNNEYIHDKNGYLTDRNNELDYMDAILYFLENPSEISKRGKNARKFATESLDWRRQAKKFIEVYKKVIG